MSDELEPQQTPRKRALRIALICFAICALLFTCGGTMLADQSMRGAFVSWVQLDPPPGQPVELRLEPNGAVLLETAEGQLYEWSRYDGADWETVAAAADSTPFWGDCRAGKDSYFVVPNPPGRVHQRVESTCPGPEMALHFEVVLLENDELWSWSYSSMGTTGPIGVIYRGVVVVGGLGLSLLVSGLVYILSSISWRPGG